jgi:hypothetical protein
MIENTDISTTTQTPKGYQLSDLLQDVLEVVTLPISLIRCVFAVAVSVHFRLQPQLWLMMVGVPSSAKTELVRILKNLPFVYFLDSMTQNPFASGYKPPGKAKSFDLLPELDGKCFIVKDYTTLFSLNEETTKKLLGELTSIFDGEFAKFSPTRGLLSYASEFSHIGCVTPATLNVHQRYLNIIGPRFLFYRIPYLSTDRRQHGFTIAWSKQNRKQKLESIRERAVKYFDQLLQGNPSLVEITNTRIQQVLESLALLLTRARGIVITQRESFQNENGNNITYYEVLDRQIEEPWRALGQLKNLAACLVFIDSRLEVNEDDCQVLKTVVLSSMPAERADVLEFFLDHDYVTAKNLTDVTGKSLRTCQRLLKELESVEIIKAAFVETGLAKQYMLVEDFLFLKDKTFLSTPPASEFLSRYPIPPKPVKQYSEDELEGMQVYLGDVLKNSDLPETDRIKLDRLFTDVATEMVERNIIHPESSMPIQDQLLINQSIKESGGI